MFVVVLLKANCEGDATFSLSETCACYCADLVIRVLAMANCKSRGIWYGGVIELERCVHEADAPTGPQPIYILEKVVNNAQGGRCPGRRCELWYDYNVV